MKSKIEKFKKLKIKVEILKRHYNELVDSGEFSEEEVADARDMYYNAKTKLGSLANDIIPQAHTEVIIESGVLASLQILANELFDPGLELSTFNFNRMNNAIADFLIEAAFGFDAEQLYINLRRDIQSGQVAKPLPLPAPPGPFDDGKM